MEGREFSSEEPQPIINELSLASRVMLSIFNLGLISPKEFKVTPEDIQKYQFNPEGDA